MEPALVWIFRAIGLLWIVGGAAIIRQSWQLHRIGEMTDELEAMAEEMSEGPGEAPPEQVEEPDDRARNLWIGVGGVLVFLTGCALLAASWLAVPLSVLVCLHQTAYLARQVWRQRKAKSEADKAAEAIAPATRNASIFAFAVSACAIYLTLSGAYG